MPASHSRSGVTAGAKHNHQPALENSITIKDNDTYHAARTELGLHECAGIVAFNFRATSHPHLHCWSRHLNPDAINGEGSDNKKARKKVKNCRQNGGTSHTRRRVSLEKAESCGKREKGGTQASERNNGQRRAADGLQSISPFS